MKSKGISYQKISAIAKDIADGLSNKEACLVNDVGERSFYDWLTIAELAADKSEPSKHEKICVQFSQSIKKARIRRKQSRIKQLSQMPSPAGLIFLLKNEYPAEFNKQPVLIPNFQKLEEYMASEYTQAEIDGIRGGILEAEERRQSEVTYAEDESFTQHKESKDA